MRVSLDVRAFEKQLNNIANYSFGFLDGINRGKKVFLDNMGRETIKALALYIDSAARMDNAALQHVYEWYQTGSPSARLFDLDYTVSNNGLSLKSNFRQSNSVSNTSSEPFYNKAKIMENGIPITIRPKRRDFLAFEDSDGQMVFTKNPVTVEQPGGPQAKGSFEKTFDAFFKYYFTQAFLRSSGLMTYLENPILYKKNMAQGARSGKNYGIKTGYTWITNATIGVD